MELDGANGGTVDVAKQGEEIEKTGGIIHPPEGVVIRCPRCDSSNTKFCYYNNYNYLTQPRHFCKTCRRYWTKGGALRNVPIGGGCRKSKKKNTNKANYASSSSFPSPSSSRRFFNDEEAKNINGVINNTNMISSIFQLPSSATLASSNAMKLYNGFSSPPSIDFHGVGGLPKSPSSSFDRFLLNSDLSSLPLSSPSLASNGKNSGYGFCGHSTGLYQGSFLQGRVASSLESSTIMNADLQWRLQQQRLASLLAEGSSHQEAIGSGGYGQSQYKLNVPLPHQQHITSGVEHPNSLRTIDGVSNFSCGYKTATSVVEPRESPQWEFENAWRDLQRLSSLP